MYWCKLSMSLVSQNQNEPYILFHDINTNNSHSEDGFVQTFTLRTQSMTTRHSIYISMAAVNKVLIVINNVNNSHTIAPGLVIRYVKLTNHNCCLFFMRHHIHHYDKPFDLCLCTCIGNTTLKESPQTKYL